MPRPLPLRAALALLAAWLPLPSLTAATHTVLPDTSIQAKIDLAQPGDVVAILGGAYDQDITITKAIRLVEADGQDVTITGNITFSGVTNAPPFEGFTVGAPGKFLTVTNTTGLTLKNINGSTGAGLKASGNSKLAATHCQFNSVEQDGGQLTLTDSQITTDFLTTASSEKTVAFRVAIGRLADWASKKSWLGYSSVSRINFAGSGCSFTVVGSTITSLDVPRPCDYCYLVGEGNKFQILNCNFRNMMFAEHGGGWSGGYSRAIVIGAGNSAVVANNYLELIPTGGFSQNYWAGVGVDTYSTDVLITNNIIQGAFAGINAPFGVRSRNNFHYNYYWYTEKGGVVPSSMLIGDPKFVADQAPKLQSTSPCVNAGVADPNFNDLDGTRNDIGPGGGCFFDPDGWTTDKPVVIAFDLGPPQLLQGTDTEVTLSNGQAVSQD